MIKQIQVPSQILRMEVDAVEIFVYFACDNLNVYQYPICSAQDGTYKQRKTLTHKKRITAMCLSMDGRHLVTGDASGLIYVWALIEEPSTG